MPEREKVGNCRNGMVAKRLLTRMKKNSAKRYGTYRAKSREPMISRPIELRTKP